MTFANAGTFISALGTGTQRASAAALDSSGRVYVGGWSGSATPDDFLDLRLTAAGVLDPTLADGGVAVLDFAGRVDRSGALLLQEDGRQILLGTSGVGAQADSYGTAAARLMPTGAIDPSFGSGGTMLSLPPPNAQTGAAAGAFDRCGIVTVGTWTYDLNTMAKNAMGVARYRR